MPAEAIRSRRRWRPTIDKIASTKPLKEGNRIYVGLIVIVNSLLHYTVAQESTISVAGVKALLTDSTNLLR